ncbi:MFS transporter [Micractinium conductrix]|uniref:MFS transporter n=1 Tax=Micractinium conductrix TaxID=554055 RepID=A0A2P6V9Y8_9CHLO|nr:MFS transporter [Micractinium conductrix]|eukprot:PSC70904.1 MFS transporter [Micractinium conductrix]
MSPSEAADAAAMAPESGEREVLYLPLGEPAPLATWRSLCLVSTSWAAALRSIPVGLDMSPLTDRDLASPHLLAWLCSINVVRLEFGQQQRAGLVLGQRRFVEARGPRLVAVAAVADSSSWQPSAFPSLPVLVLDCGHSSLGSKQGDREFKSATVAGNTGLRMLQRNRFSPGVTVNWADCVRAEKCIIHSAAVLLIQIPTPSSLPLDPAAIEKHIACRMAADLEAGNCCILQLQACGQVNVRGGSKQDSELLVARRLEGGQRVARFAAAITPHQIEQLTRPGAPPMATVHFAEGAGGDPGSAAVLSHPAFAKASAGTLSEATHVLLARGLSLARYSKLARLYAFLPGPIQRGTLPPSVTDLKLTCLPEFPPAARRLDAGEALAELRGLAALRLQGWAQMDLRAMPSTISSAGGKHLRRGSGCTGGCSTSGYDVPVDVVFEIGKVPPSHNLSDPALNTKLLMLCTAQLLSSVATLLHDTYLPLFMSEVLHMSNTRMGNLHGLLQFLARASGVVSGRLADVLSPARMVILGMGLTALVCKPAFALCGTMHVTLGTAACLTWITYAKILDRLVKGIREAPSKAIVSELAARSGDSASAAFSARYALSTLGMLLGSGAAAAAFQATRRSYPATFALSVVPALAGLALVAAAFGGDAKAAASACREQATARAAGEREGVAALSPADKARLLWAALPRGYWQALATTCIIYLGRFDVAFITVHASSVMDPASLPMLTICSMVPAVTLAAPMGHSAKYSAAARNTVLVLGCLVSIVGDLCFSLNPSTLGMIAGSTCVGLHLAMTQGVIYGMLSSYIPATTLPGLGRITGTAWSLSDLILGIVLAYANALAGHLCDFTAQRGMGTSGCFLGRTAISALAVVALLLFSAFGELGREPPAAAVASNANVGGSSSGNSAGGGI